MPLICNHAHRITIRVKQICIFVAIALAGTGIITDGITSKIVTLGVLLSVLLAVIADSFKTKLED